MTDPAKLMTHTEARALNLLAPLGQREFEAISRLPVSQYFNVRPRPTEELHAAIRKARKQEQKLHAMPTGQTIGDYTRDDTNQ